MFINTISESKSKTFKECQLKYRYRYVDRLKEEAKNMDALNFGSYIHKIFEDGYQAKSKDALLIIAERVKKDYPFSDSYIPKISTCIENFLNFNDTLTETVATEFVYEVVYDAEKDIKLNGIIDRIVKGSDGSYLVIDYKTSKRELNKVDLYQDRQMQGYAYAVHKLMNVPLEKIHVAHYYPITGHLVSVQFSAAQITRYIKEKVEQIWKIRKMKKTDFQPMENQFCNWCGYKNLCPLFSDPMLIEGRIECAKEKQKKKK